MSQIVQVLTTVAWDPSFLYILNSWKNVVHTSYRCKAPVALSRFWSTITHEYKNFSYYKFIVDTRRPSFFIVGTHNTHQSYKTAMSVFQKFHKKIYNTSPEFPINVAQVIYFVSWQHTKGKSHKTINTYVTGLYHRLKGFQTQHNFLLSKN